MSHHALRSHALPGLLATVLLAGACASDVPASQAPTALPTPAAERPCSQPSVADAETVDSAPRARYDEPVSVRQVDNDQLEDDIIEVTVGSPASTAPDGGSARPVDWRVQVEARHISGGPRISVFDLVLIDSNGSACPLTSVDPAAAALAPGRAQRQRTTLTYRVDASAPRDYVLVLIDPKTTMVVRAWR